jgi:hypothetical protein
MDFRIRVDYLYDLGFASWTNNLLTVTLWLTAQSGAQEYINLHAIRKRS